MSLSDELDELDEEELELELLVDEAEGDLLLRFLELFCFERELLCDAGVVIGETTAGGVDDMSGVLMPPACSSVTVVTSVTVVADVLLEAGAAAGGAPSPEDEFEALS